MTPWGDDVVKLNEGDNGSVSAVDDDVHDDKDRYGSLVFARPTRYFRMY